MAKSTVAFTPDMRKRAFEEAQAIHQSNYKKFLEGLGLEEMRTMDKRVSSLKRLSEASKVDPEAFMPRQIADRVQLMHESGQFDKEDFSFKLLREYAMNNYVKLGEANAPQAFGQLFRGYIQAEAQNWYKLTEANWNQYIQETSSKGRQEFYAPLQGTGFPSKVGPGETYNQGQVVGLDIEIINLKFGLILVFDKELFDDDQTGQIRSMSQSMGESMKIAEEAYIAARLNGGTVGGVATTFNYGALVVPPTKYAWTNFQGATGTGPYANNRFSTNTGPGKTATGNVLQNSTTGAAAMAVLSAPALRQARYQARNARNLLGLKMIIDARKLVISTTDEDTAGMLANSQFYPGVPGLRGENIGSAQSGSTGWTNTQNFLKGMIDPIENRYLQDWEWYLGTGQKGMVFQRRAPWETVQEVPNSGADFAADQIRFKSRARFEADWVDSSFWIQGNDGSVVGSF